MSKSGWFFSVLLHVGVVLAVVLGLPNLFESDALDEPIVVSLVAIADEAPAPAPDPAPEPEARAAPEPPPDEEPAPVPEPVAEPAPPEPEPAPEPVAEPAPEPEPIPEPVVEPAPEPEPVPEPVAEPAPEPAPLPEPPPQMAALPPQPEPAPPVPEPAPAPAAEPEAPPAAPPLPPSARPAPPPPSFDTLLKDITEDDAEAPTALPPDEDSSFEDFIEQMTKAGEDEDAAPKQATLGSDPRLWRTLTGAIKQKVEANWSVPAGVRDADRMVVTLRIRLGKDGTVHSAEVVEDDSASGGSFRIMAESARRAELKASPFEVLTPHGDDYERWRDITMTFEPPV